MQSRAFTFGRSWGVRSLSLVLMLVMGLQGVPLQSLIQGILHTGTHHECSHATGYCPMNPDGPCPCTRTGPDTESPDTSTIRACNGRQSDGISISAVGKWLLDVPVRTPSPHTHSVARLSTASTLSSQCMGADVFRPPRQPANLRPELTLSAHAPA